MKRIADIKNRLVDKLGECVVLNTEFESDWLYHHNAWVPHVEKDGYLFYITCECHEDNVKVFVKVNDVINKRTTPIFNEYLSDKFRKDVIVNQKNAVYNYLSVKYGHVDVRNWGEKWKFTVDGKPGELLSILNMNGVRAETRFNRNGKLVVEIEKAPF